MRVAVRAAYFCWPPPEITAMSLLLAAVAAILALLLLAGYAKPKA
ncbi:MULTISPECIES: hypothetical protein [unclassified Rhodanobacter]|nr:hypothetical protein [Rhodanobacter sp. OR444]